MLEKKILRKIFGANRINEYEYKKKSNAELYQLFTEADIISFIKSNDDEAEMVGTCEQDAGA